MNAQKNTPSAESDVLRAARSIPVAVHAQYVRDVSFENPLAPDSLKAGQPSPKMDININMDARKLQEQSADSFYEVVIHLSARAHRNDQTVFMATIEYGVTVSLPGVPDDAHHPMLLIEVPKIAFPFIRQILSDLTQQGGYPPLLLSPVDFYALYMERFGEQIKQAKAAGGKVA